MTSAPRHSRRPTRAAVAIVAVAAIAMAAGGVHLLAQRQVDEAVRSPSETARLAHFALIADVDDPPHAIFQVTLELTNHSTVPVQAHLAEVTVAVDGASYQLTAATPSATIAPREATTFSAQFSIAGSELDRLRSHGPISVRIAGTTIASAQLLWIRGAAEEPVVIEHIAQID